MAYGDNSWLTLNDEQPSASSDQPPPNEQEAGQGFMESSTMLDEAAETEVTGTPAAQTPADTTQTTGVDPEQKRIEMEKEVRSLVGRTPQGLSPEERHQWVKDQLNQGGFSEFVQGDQTAVDQMITMADHSNSAKNNEADPTQQNNLASPAPQNNPGDPERGQQNGNEGVELNVVNPLSKDARVKANLKNMQKNQGDAQIDESSRDAVPGGDRTSQQQEQQKNNEPGRIRKTISAAATATGVSGIVKGGMYGDEQPMPTMEKPKQETKQEPTQLQNGQNQQQSAKMVQMDTSPSNEKRKGALGRVSDKLDQRADNLHNNFGVKGAITNPISAVHQAAATSAGVADDLVHLRMYQACKTALKGAWDTIKRIIPRNALGDSGDTLLKNTQSVEDLPRTSPSSVVPGMTPGQAKVIAIDKRREDQKNALGQTG